MDDEHGANSRRHLLRWGARLAVSLPALLAGLQLAGGTARADDDDGDDDRARGRGRGRGPRVEVEVENERENNTTFSAALVPINQINTGDFNPGGSDSGFGTLAVRSNGSGSASSVFVRLRGATANLTYNVQFVPLNNAGARQQLGSLTTNAAGNANVDLANVLGQSGSAASNNLGTRVGSFVLVRSDNNTAAFVTAA